MNQKFWWVWSPVRQSLIFENSHKYFQRSIRISCSFLMVKPNAIKIQEQWLIHITIMYISSHLKYLKTCHSSLSFAIIRMQTWIGWMKSYLSDSLFLLNPLVREVKYNHVHSKSFKTHFQSLKWKRIIPRMKFQPGIQDPIDWPIGPSITESLLEKMRKLIRYSKFRIW